MAKGKGREHEAERFVKLLEEQFQRDLRALKEWWRVDGRPAFTTELTPDEELAWWMDPVRRVAMLEKIRDEKGFEAMQKFEAKMREREAEYRGQMGVPNG